MSPGEPGLTELFVDATVSAGLDFQHINGMSGEFYFSGMVGGGVALFDYDNDGDLDLYITQVNSIDGEREKNLTNKLVENIGKCNFE